MSAENTTPQAPNNNFEQARRNAEAVLARKLSSQTIGSGDQAQFLNAKVQIDTGLAKDSFGEEKQHNETIRLTIESPQVEEFQSDIRSIVEKTIQQIEPLDEVVRARSAEQEVEYVKTKLEELIEAGANVPKSMLKWAGFDKRNEQQYEIQEHLLSISRGSGAFVVSIDLPKNLPDDTGIAAIKENISTRIDDIKTMLAERLVKKLDGSEQEKENIKAQINALTFEIDSKEPLSPDDEFATSNIYITIKSSEQIAVAEEAKEKNGLLNTEDESLKSTNILETLDPKIVSKALSRALQTAGGEKAEAVMPVIIGASDVRRKLEKELTKFGIEKPQFAHQIADVLNSNILVRDYVEAKDRKFTKQPIQYDKKTSDRGKFTVEMTVPEGQAGQIIRNIAAINKGAEQNVDPATAKFASIDHVEVVGAYSSNPQMHQLLQQAVAPMVGQQISGADSGDKMKEFATRLIQLVTEAHDAAGHMENGQDAVKAEQNAKTMIAKVEEAYKNITEGIKYGAHQKAEAAIDAQAQRAYSNANPEHQTPTTTMTPDWIQRLVKRTSDQSTNYALGA